MNKYWNRVKISIILALGLLLSACSSSEESASEQTGKSDTSSDSAPRELVVADFGGSTSEALQKAVYKPFEEKFNVKITVDGPFNPAKMKGMAQTGKVTWDVIYNDLYVSYLLAEEGILEKLDYNKINTDGIPEYLLNDYNVVNTVVLHNLAYNSEVYPDDNHPKTWADLYDTNKFPGPRGVYKGPIGTFEQALLADGVPKEELYPLDVERALKKLETIKDDIIWWDTGAIPPQLLGSKEVSLSHAWSSRIAIAAREGLPLENEFDGASEWYVGFSVPKGTRDKELAMEFINFSNSPEVLADLFTLLDYAPANKKVINLLPEEKKTLFNSLEQNDTIVHTDQEYWAKNFEELNKQFNDWLLK